MAGLGFLGSRSERALGRRLKVGQLDSVGRPRSSKILDSWSTSFFPGSRASLLSSSPNIQPTLHISTLLPYRSSPSNSSGLRYQSVTTNWVIFGAGSPQ